ncbi:MAG: hypothetical protein GY728_06055 [Phycisphaeraceae bacterium]|nr:hypothetical protein [Phycisphaeraceae bacterium]MCP4741627.1 hypothetical protein [Actinomycetales bacterium]
MSATVSQALDYYLTARQIDLEVGSLRPSSMSKLREFCGMLRAHLPESELVESLTPSHFRDVILNASQRWGPLRLRQLRQFLKGWLDWCEEDGVIERRPRLGKLPQPPVHIVPKPAYLASEYRELWSQGDRITRIIMGLGLFAGCNCSDIEQLSPESIDGQWFVQPRAKTGRARRAALPSFLISEINQAKLPLWSQRGPLTAKATTKLWQNRSSRILGERRSFTSWRTTLRTIAGQVDGEALELAVMGHSPSLASKQLGRAQVGLEHYVRIDAISDDRLRSIRKAVLDWLA